MRRVVAQMPTADLLDVLFGAFHLTDVHAQQLLFTDFALTDSFLGIRIK